MVKLLDQLRTLDRIDQGIGQAPLLVLRQLASRPYQPEPDRDLVVLGAALLPQKGGKFRGAREGAARGHASASS